MPRGRHVPFDFGKVGAGSAIDSAIDPIDIYSALPDPPWQYLRQPQGDVLQKWFRRRDESDLVIKMNTGAGKTVVGLLVLKSRINEGLGPAAYFTADRYLTQQVLDEAARLGLKTTTDPRSPDFGAAEAILVANINVLFNGRSKFGVGQKKIDVQSILIDDAHACIETAREQFTLRVPRSSDAYFELLNLFRDDLSGQSRLALIDLEAQTPGAFYEVPFWAWRSKVSQAIAILHSLSSTSDDPLFWQWPLIADWISETSCYFTPDSAEISPPCSPVMAIPAFETAGSRIYLTATLSDDSVLVTDLDASPNSVRKPITPGSADDIGDRLILAPQELIPSLSEDELLQMIKDLGAAHSVVILTPSFARAEYWRPIADNILSSLHENLESGVRNLRESSPTGITVLVARYNGIDLPDRSCRVLVVDGMPNVQSARQMARATAQSGTNAALVEQTQLLEQGMGRGVRSKADYCVVLLLGSKLAQLVASPRGRDSFSPATRKQLELSRRVAQELSGSSIETVREVIDQCLNQDPGWKAASRDALVGTRYADEVDVSPNQIARREAYSRATINDHVGAVRKLEEAANEESDAFEKAWLKKELAIYLDAYDSAAAQEVLLSALNANRYLRPLPLAGVQFSRLATATGSQAERSANHIASLANDGNALLLYANSLLDDLSMPSRSSDAFEDAILRLGEFLGLASQRPERELGEGPDSLWGLGPTEFAVIECKSQASTGLISKADINQLSGSANWFGRRYPDADGTPVLVHRVRDHDSRAAPTFGARVIDEASLAKLRDGVRRFARALAERGWSSDEVSRQLVSQNLNAGVLLSHYSAPPRSA
jgi:hypothetical protein